MPDPLIVKTPKDPTSLYPDQRSTLILIIGKSGRGKTTAIRNLPPENTLIINPTGKLLPFPRGREYKEGINLTVEDTADRIKQIMRSAPENKNLQYLILDDAQHIMAKEFMDKALVKGYDKFTIMAKNMWDILRLANELKLGLKVFVLTHEEETSYGERKMKTLGKLLDEKLTPEGLSNIVLFADVAGDSAEERTYYFQTQSDGKCSAKSPMGMFPLYIANDLFLIAQRIDEYYNDIALEQSKVDNLEATPAGDTNRRRR